MNVKDLQHFLHSLSQPLIAAGAKKAADDLDRACAAMEPFGELSIPQFADFLANAEVYARTGAVPVTGAPKRAAPRSSTKPGGPEAVTAAVDRIKSLYERVCTPEVTYANIEAEVASLDKLLKEQLVEVARCIGVTGSFKSSKQVIQNEIRRRMTERKESFQRTRF
jgi:hypothetical protein